MLSKNSSTNKIECKNCGNSFQGNFCNQCGQKVFERFSRTYLWLGLRKDLFEIDNGLLLTFRQLWLHPGTMVLKYINGETKRYYSPLKYLFFWMALYLFAISFTTKPDQNNSLADLVINSHPIFSKETFFDFIAVWRFVAGTLTNIYLLGLIPFLTTTDYYFHIRSKFNFTEVLILITYFYGQFVFVAFVLTLITPYIDPVRTVEVKIADILLVLAYYYLFFKIHKLLFST